MRGLVLMCCLVAVGCSSRLPTEEERAVSQAASRRQLVEVSYVADANGLQWVSPDLELSDYQQVMVEPVKLHPRTQAVHQISPAVLTRVSQRLQHRLEQELAAGVPVVDKTGPKTAILRVEITRASTDMEDLKITEILPYGALIGGTKALLGTRDRNVRLLVESQLVDSLSDDILAERVSVLLAKDVLENDREMLRFEQIQETVDTFTQDIVYFIRLTAYTAKENEDSTQ
ncbi:DUF3313 domain-containing protein [Photobacterium gaetbulicola]|uniref:Outer membrane lipoprotein n=1 Tax=Photobacterium gaetbulicola Gung47 TaxID=658445 RepID=A0A0C5WWA0_9GAMM|nr:DUF3313 domain-containing protein [Photobacterium gaetbulicola]AJR09284.1 hypothetical protein H744_2c2628 [Photobacterium gaetbulicola Gung47]PSU04009.1 DUF3313 domain-containing protein [Photobacterium gaetbulicola]